MKSFSLIFLCVLASTSLSLPSLVRHPSSVHEPLIRRPSMRGPSMRGPSVHDPSVHGSSVHRPGVAPQVQPTTTATSDSGKWFDRIVVVNLENTNYEDALKTGSLVSFAKNGLLLTNYFAVTHPSQPNYVAQIMGDTSGVWLDFECNLDGPSLVDLMDAKSVTWKAYQENYPTDNPCFIDSATADGLYVRKHNPFMSLVKVNTNPDYCSKHIYNADSFYADLKNGTLPQLSYYTPNMNNDGHDTSIEYAGKWFAGFSQNITSYAENSDRTLIFVTFDEQSSWFGSNQVYAALFGSAVPKSMKGKKNAKRFDHYSLLRTIEDNWALGSLNKNDATSVSFFA